MTIREGRWDCPHCGTTGILGRHQQCLNCGSPRPEGVKFYLPENAPEVTDEQQLAQARSGPDWACEHCGASNSAGNGFCTQCGAPKGSSPEQAVKVYTPNQVPRTGKISQPIQNLQPPLPKKRSRPWGIGHWVALMVLVLSIGLGVRFILPREVSAIVTQETWERTIQVEIYKTVTEEGWSVPAGGRLLSQRAEIHHYNQVLDRYETRTRQVSERVQVGTTTRVCGQRDLGNGYFEDVTCTEPVYETRYRTETYQEPIYRQEPVYQTKYRYEIEKWVYNRTAKATGTQQQPYWPSLTLAANEREATRTEDYKVVLTDAKGKAYEIQLNQQDWQTFDVGQTHKLKVSFFGENVEILTIPTP